MLRVGHRHVSEEPTIRPVNRILNAAAFSAGVNLATSQAVASAKLRLGGAAQESNSSLPLGRSTHRSELLHKTKRIHDATFL